jgi:hypothetical protein
LAAIITNHHVRGPVHHSQLTIVRGAAPDGAFSRRHGRCWLVFYRMAQMRTLLEPCLTLARTAIPVFVHGGVKLRWAKAQDSDAVSTKN